MSTPSSSEYISTRGGIKPVNFCDAVIMGLADDGGLLLPGDLPSFSNRLAELRELSYPKLAFQIIKSFVGDDIAHQPLSSMITNSYIGFQHPDVTPLVKTGPLHIMELFHGPTLAFKDVALQFLGNCFEHILAERGTHLNILGATSGDTGSAAIYGVRGREHINIFVMHPHGRVSPVQEYQMTTVLDENVHNIAIKGTFDDGQAIMKEILGDLTFKQRFKLGTVNSVNWARVLAQIVYYFYASLKLSGKTGAHNVQIAVPTGNFGNILAGYLAKRMGAPIRNLVLATNENDILSRFFNTGEYSISQVKRTLSPSMDIQVASNFERYLYYLLGKDTEAVKRYMSEFKHNGRIKVPFNLEETPFCADSANKQQTLGTIARYHQEHNYLLDPHTAAGVAVAERFVDDDCPMVCLATAHPAKFPDAVREAVGEDIATHPRIEGILELPTRCTVLPADKNAIESFIEKTLTEEHKD